MKKRKWMHTMFAFCLACSMITTSVPGVAFVQAAEVQVQEDKKTVLDDFTMRKSPKEEKYFWDGNAYHDGNVLAYNIAYTGEEIEPAVTGEGLEEATDYSVDYSNNREIGTATVTVTGIGNYEGTKELHFTITQKKLDENEWNITLSANSFTYTGNKIEPAVTVEGFVQGVDYTVEYKDNINVGTATVLVKGVGKYQGELSKTFEIDPQSITDKEVTYDTQAVYTGKEICPEVTVEGLTGGVDYTVTYTDNLHAGTGKITITGKGNYSGTIEKTFTIYPAAISEENVSLTETSFVYTGSQIKPEVTVEGLKEGTDYFVEYKDNTNAGTAAVIITGKNDYTGTVEKSFMIEKADISKKKLTFTAGTDTFEFDGSAVCPDVTVEGLEKSDYTVSYQKNIHAGTAVVTLMGTGNYTGMLQTEFTIKPKNLTSADIILDKETYEYTGEEICPEVSISDIRNADYEITACSYKNNKTIGKASVTVTCTGDFEGTATKEFSITQADIQNAITNISVDNNGFASKGNNYYYTGSEIKPRLELYGLTEGVDYVVSYKNNINVGTASIIVSGKGMYKGTYTYTFNIIPVSSGGSDPTDGTGTSNSSGTHQTGSTGNTGSSSTQSPVKVFGIKVTGISKQIAAGKKIKLTATPVPSAAANKTVRWTSSNPKVATVNQAGLVKMNKKSAGKSVIITATAMDGSGVKAAYKIKSMKGIVKKVTISGAKTVKAGKALKAKAKVSATKGANKKITWISSNTNYAVVSPSGKIKTSKSAKGKKVKITAMATDGSGKKAVLNIKIK